MASHDGAMPAASEVPPRRAGTTSTGALLLITVAVLYFGKDIFIPLALAVLAAFVLAPFTLWLRRIGLPRIAAVIIALVAALAILLSVASVVAVQVVELAGNLPSYRQTISHKIGTLQASFGQSGVLSRVTGTIRELTREIDSRADQLPPAEALPSKREPVPVVIEQGPARPLDIIWSVFGPLVGPLGTAGLVLVFVAFILFEREDLRDRFIKLAGGGDLRRSTEAITEAGQRVSRYLLMQLIVNVTYGIPIGIGLWLIGIPNAALWGFLAAVLRFIPYLGPWIAALFPLTIAIAVDPGWTMLAWVAALIIAMELVSNNAVEPWLYGSSTGLSSFAIIVAAIFWTVLWGPAGLFLATPLTVCLVVVGRYVPGFEFLGVMLGSDPVLAPEERFYQRLLAGNIEEAIEMAEESSQNEIEADFYATVAIPALRLAETDRQRAVDIGIRRNVADGVIAVVQDLSDVVPRARSERGNKSNPAEKPADEARRSWRGKALCIGGRTEVDEAVSEILADRLRRAGIESRVLPPLAVGRTALSQLDLDGVAAIALSYFHPRPLAYARYVCRHLRRVAPGAGIVVCCWNLDDDRIIADLPDQTGADAVTTDLSEAVRIMETLLSRNEAAERREPKEELPPASRARLGVLRRTGIESGSGPLFDRLSRRVADAIPGAFAIVTLSDSAEGEPRELPPPSVVLPVETRIAGRLPAGNHPAVVDDVGKDDRYAHDPLMLEKGVRSLARVPILAASEHALGNLCAFSAKPHTFGKPEMEQLTAIADWLVEEIAARPGDAEQPKAEAVAAGIRLP